MICFSWSANFLGDSSHILANSSHSKNEKWLGAYCRYNMIIWILATLATFLAKFAYIEKCENQKSQIDVFLREGKTVDRVARVARGHFMLNYRGFRLATFLANEQKEWLEVKNLHFVKGVWKSAI